MDAFHLMKGICLETIIDEGATFSLVFSPAPCSLTSDHPLVCDLERISREQGHKVMILPASGLGWVSFEGVFSEVEAHVDCIRVLAQRA
jgi:hypothetical protein